MATLTRQSLVGVLALIAVGCGQRDAGPGQNDEGEILAAMESSKDFGDYVLHFNALTTDQLEPEIAAQYGIVRSNNRVLLNVSLLRNQEIGLATAVAADVRASARNLNNQLRNIPVQEIREGDAIYYIGETAIVDSESLIFTVVVTPEGSDEPLTVRFQRQFFAD